MRERTTPGPFAPALALLAALAACGGESAAFGDAGRPDGDGGFACGDGFEAAAGGCAPIFDECPPGGIAALGGGCERVGPAADCWPGFLPDGEGGCAPVLPAADCPDGTIPVVGFAECAPVGDCGDAPWGSVALDDDATFVSASYSGADADGSPERPFSRVQDGIDAAVASGWADPQVAVAAGTYEEEVLIEVPLRLDGRCAALVTIAGQRAGWPALLVAAGDVTVRGVTVTGPSWGAIALNGARSVLFENMVVRDAGLSGVTFQEGASGTLRRSLVERAEAANIVVGDGEATIEESVVRGSADPGGAGLWLEPEDGAFGMATVARSILIANRNMGVFANGATVVIDESVVRDTLAGTGGVQGVGVVADGEIEAADVTVRRSLVAGNRMLGLRAYGSRLALEDTTVRDTLAQESDGALGLGVAAEADADGDPADLAIAGCRFADNRELAIGVAGSTVTIDATVIADTLLSADARFGYGLQFGTDPETGVESAAAVRRCVVEGNAGVGILCSGATCALMDSTVRDTEPSPANGYAVDAHASPHTGAAAELTIAGSLLARSATAGLYVSGSTATVDDSAVRGVAAEGGLYGDGALARTDAATGAPASLYATRVEVRGADRAGLVFFASGGAVEACVVRDGGYAVALEDGADPAIAGDNVFAGNDRDEVVAGQGLAPPPPAGEAE